MKRSKRLLWAFCASFLSIAGLVQPVSALDYGNSGPVPWHNIQTWDIEYGVGTAEICTLSAITLNGSLSDSSVGGVANSTTVKNYLTGSGYGRCQANVGSPWVTAKISLKLEDKTFQLSCDTDPNADTYVIHGMMAVGVLASPYAQYLGEAAVSNPEYVNPVKLIIRPSVIAGLKTRFYALLVDDGDPGLGVSSNVDAILASHLGIDETVTGPLLQGYSSDLHVISVLPDPDFDQTVSVANAGNIVAHGGPMFGEGCYKPKINQITFSGSLNKVVSELPVDATQVSSATQTAAGDPGQVVDEKTASDALAFLTALAAMPDIPAIPVQLPQGALTINVTYRDALGIRRTATQAAVIDVPTPVVLPLAPLNSDIFVVTVTAGKASVGLRTASPNSARYQLRIQRSGSFLASTNAQISAAETSFLSTVMLPSPGCHPLPVDIKVIAPIQLPVAALQPPSAAIELGYEALTAGASDSPSDFTVVYENDGSYTQLHEGSTPCAGVAAGPLNVVGTYRDTAKATELTADFSMPKAVTALNLMFGKDPNTSKQIISYDSTGPLSVVSFGGKLAGVPIIVSLTSVPERIEFCQHSGSACNLAWRSDRQSLKSIKFAAHDALGNLKALNFEYHADNFTPTVNNGTRTRISATLSNFAVDYKIDVGKYEETQLGAYVLPLLGISVLTNLLPGGGYPYWVYLDTRGEPLYANIVTQSVSGGSASDDTVISAPGTTSLNRELVLRKKWYGPRFYRYGQVSCNGFGFSKHNLPGVVRTFLQNQFCN